MVMLNATLLLCLFSIIIKNCCTIDTIDTDIVRRAKRNMFCKEKAYFNTQPMSKELKKFINKFKKKRKSKTRIKHSIEENMYVLQGGNVLPVDEINSKDIRGYNKSVLFPEDAGVNYTVLPLLVAKTKDPCLEPFSLPIMVQSFITATTVMPSTTTTTSTSRITTNTSSTTTTTSSSTTSTTTAANSGTTIFTTKTDFAVSPSATFHSRTDQTKTSSRHEEVDDYEIVVRTTDGKLLHRVIEDVQELLKLQGSSRVGGDISFCNVIGDWDSYAGGVQIRIESSLNKETPKVEILTREPPMDGFLSDSAWNVSAIVPFRSQSLVAITASSNKGKKIASFLGECRQCDGAETVTGYWMLRRRSKNCKDREESNTFISDVFRKNNVRRLQIQHLADINKTTEYTETTEAT